MKQTKPFFLSPTTIKLPPVALSITLSSYLGLSIALAFLMPSFPLIGLLGAIVINLIVLFCLRSQYALPLYILTAGPSVAFQLSTTGILSRLYIGNLVFVFVSAIWILQAVLPERKSGRMLLQPGLLAPLVALNIAGLISILNSRLFPDPNVPYSYPHSNVSITIVNLSEMTLLIGLPMFLVVVPGLVSKVRDLQLVLGAYTFVGALYALGTIFAAPLNLYSKKVILGIRRPEVFGSSSSGLGTLIVLFTNITFCRFLYSHNSRARIFWGLISILLAIGVIMALGRESWIELFMTSLLILVLRTKNWWALLVLLLPLFLLLIPGVVDFFDPSKVYGSDRLIIWQDAINIWQHSPIFGIGAGNFQFFDRVYGHDQVGVAHNQFLEVLAEMGISGIIAFLWLLVAVGVKAIKAFRAAKTDLSKSVALMYLGFFVAIVFGGFFTGIFIPSAAAGGGTAAFVEASIRWILFGLVLSIPNWEKEAEKLEQHITLTENKPVQPLNHQKVPVSGSLE